MCIRKKEQWYVTVAILELFCVEYNTIHNRLQLLA
jgi:hypothetical protein